MSCKQSRTVMPISPMLETDRKEEKDPERDDEGSMKEDSGDEEEGKRKEGLSQDGETEEAKGRKAVGRTGPKMPTKVEQEEHAWTHCPYRSWCKRCVQARARSSPHRAGDGARKGAEEGVGSAKAPRVAMGYSFMSKANEKTSTNPLMVMADEESGSRYARAVGEKGLGNGQELGWLIVDMCTQLRAWGHAVGAGGELIVKSEGDIALLAAKGAVAKHAARQGRESRKGMIEEAGETTREYACAFISQFEEGIK